MTNFFISFTKTLVICLTALYAYTYTLNWLTTESDSRYGLIKIYKYRNDKLVKEDTLVNDRVSEVFREHELYKQNCDYKPNAIQFAKAKKSFDYSR